jgi:queuine tRNA-ribosyltransferase
LAYLNHLFSVGDPLGLRLATLHNLRFYTQLLEHIALQSE